MPSIITEEAQEDALDYFKFIPIENDRLKRFLDEYIESKFEKSKKEKENE